MKQQAPEFKRPESVLVIVHQQSQVLLLQRQDNHNFWQSVTGSMLEEEAEPVQTAWRELKEETGLTRAHGQMHDCQQQEWFEIYPERRYRYAPGTIRNLEHVFRFELSSPVEIILSNEHVSFCWLTKAEAAAKAYSRTNREAILKFVP